MGMIAKTLFPVDPEILNLVSELDEFKGAWRATGSLAPDRLTALRHVATIESIGSSTRIEGSKLSNADVRSLLSGLSAQSLTTRDEQEVAGYAAVMDLLFESWADIDLTENHICQLHQELLKFSEKDHWHRGQYKTSPNNVVAFDAEGCEIGVVFETATPFDTPIRMKELVAWYLHETHPPLHPLIRVGIFVVTFLEIHPFQDGNGRLSRVLTTLLLLRAGYAHVPYASLESVIERSKDSYYMALRQTQLTIRTDQPNWGPWLSFFLTALQRQKNHLQTKIDREKLVLASMLNLSVKIMDHVREHGRITMAEAVILTQANRNTLKKRFAELVDADHLILNGKGRGAWYGAKS
jgi:Fic family protein